MMTDEQFKSWLMAPDSIRCLLVEVGVNVSGVEITRYLANANYVSASSDTPANQPYLPLIGGSVSINESISVDGSASMSFGDIEINNTSEEFDSWLDDIWDGRAINVFVGDVRWPKANFRQVFSGTVAGVASRDAYTLNLQLRDKLQRLNTPVSDQVLGGSTDNKDSLIPVCFGEVHNISPLLVNPTTLTYQVHNGPIERIIEVRDNGVPVGFTADLANGKFSLTSASVGTITASVQGDKPSGVYTNKVGDLIKRIVKSYGKASDRFVDVDIDLTNFAAFTAAHAQPVGLYLSDRTNVLDACAYLASSVGAQLVMSSVGKLRLLKLDLPATGTPTQVTARDMDMGTIHVIDRPKVVAAVKLGFCRNYTVQEGLETGIPSAHKDLFKKEWLTSIAMDLAAADDYHLSTEVDQVDTALITRSSADSEAMRRMGIWGVQRTVIGYTANAGMLLQELGGAQTITHRRFSLSGGKTGQVVALNRDWSKGTVEVGVLV